jgi:hypothetical protein
MATWNCGQCGKLVWSGALGDHVCSPEVEAGKELERLLKLPVETRRALYLLIQEHGEAFNGVPHAKHTKKYPPTKGSP